MSAADTLPDGWTIKRERVTIHTGTRWSRDGAHPIFRHAWQWIITDEDGIERTCRDTRREAIEYVREVTA